jgi:hypothetical protein
LPIKGGAHIGKPEAFRTAGGRAAYLKFTLHLSQKKNEAGSTFEFIGMFLSSLVPFYF